MYIYVLHKNILKSYVLEEYNSRILFSRTRALSLSLSLTHVCVCVCIYAFEQYAMNRPSLHVTVGPLLRITAQSQSHSTWSHATRRINVRVNVARVKGSGMKQAAAARSRTLTQAAQRFACSAP